jgi:hypothetical protein
MALEVMAAEVMAKSAAPATVAQSVRSDGMLFSLEVFALLATDFVATSRDWAAGSLPCMVPPAIRRRKPE